MDKNEYWNEKDNERYQKMKAEINVRTVSRNRMTGGEKWVHL